MDDERKRFMSSSLKDMYQRPTRVAPSAEEDADNADIDIRKLLKDVYSFGASHMSWKERKKIENERALSLGGKPLKKQKVPLTIAKATMKNQKKKEQKLLEEGTILDKFRGNRNRRNDKFKKRKPEERVLRATEGHFRNGMLDVTQLMKPASSSGDNDDTRKGGHGKKGKKGKNKKKGFRKKH